MAKRYYYEILGVSKDSDERTIKKAYRKLARTHHPDASSESPEVAEKKFKEISEAYEVLADKEKRSRYDRFGHEGVDFDGGGFSWDQFSHGADISDIFGQLFRGGQRGGMGDIFSQFFGGSQRGPNNRGDDLRYDVTMTLEEAYKGMTKKVEIPRDGTCNKCTGSGAADGGIARTCNTCGGQGMVQKVMRRGFMSTVSTDTCPNCKGSGKTIDKPCGGCRGSGIISVKKKIKLEIPPGADHGFKLRMRRQGGAGPNNGPKGDLYIVVNVQKHEIFKRQNNEIILDLEITPAQAVIGDSLEVPTLSGKVKLKIPSGTQTGDVLRLKRKGMPDMSRPSIIGSQHVRINVKVPKPNGKTRKLWEQLRELDSEKPSFLDKIMDKFG